MVSTVFSYARGFNSVNSFFVVVVFVIILTSFADSLILNNLNNSVSPQILPDHYLSPRMSIMNSRWVNLSPSQLWELITLFLICCVSDLFLIMSDKPYLLQCSFFNVGVKAFLLCRELWESKHTVLTTCPCLLLFGLSTSLDRLVLCDISLQRLSLTY